MAETKKTLLRLRRKSAGGFRTPCCQLVQNHQRPAGPRRPSYPGPSLHRGVLARPIHDDLRRFARENIKVAAMVARHGDAELISETLRAIDVELIRGAGAGERKRDRGGAAALRASLRALADGYSLVMTADVPPGPARVAGAGIVTIARMSGRPIVPVAVSTKHFASFDTWSRITVNLPYSNLGIRRRRSDRGSARR